MFRKLFYLSVLGLLTLSPSAFATTRAVQCYGCSDVDMAHAATIITTVGTDIVYVFNEVSEDVKKFQVFTNREDSIPFTIVKEANELPVDPVLKSDYKDAVRSVVESTGRNVVLPPDFYIKSAAHAARAPESAVGWINQHLNNLGWWETTTINVNKVVSGLLAKNVPFLDFGGLFSNPLIIVTYPDGSQQKYNIQNMFNLLSAEFEYIVNPVPGTATDQDGNPIPTIAQEFSGRTFEDINGGLSDWVEYAREHNVTIIGTAQQSSVMVCFARTTTHFVCELKMH